MKRITATLTGAAAALLLAAPFAPAATAPAGAVGETCDGKAATLVVPAPAPGTWSTPTFTGTPGDDVIVGTARPDAIEGGGGNDTICGLAGDDELLGGEGDDRLFGGLDGEYITDEGYRGDRIEPGPGDDYVDLGHDPQTEDLWWGDTGLWDQVSYRNATAPVAVDLAAGVASGEGTDTIVPVVYAGGIEGSAHADHLLGTDHDDWITAGGGDDTVDARAGDDTIRAEELSGWWNVGAGPGDDAVQGGPGHDVIWAGHGKDQISGGDGGDVIWLDRGVGAAIVGGAGDDTITASGRARVEGGPGADRLQAGIRVLSDLVRLDGGPGRDLLDLDTSMRVAPQRSLLIVGDPAGTVRVRGKGVLTRFSSIEGFEGTGIPVSLRVIYHGTSGPNVLDLEMQEGWVRAYGRGGNDWLRSGWGNDLLDGGPGRDTLYPEYGRDRCMRGERMESCEVRRTYSGVS